MLVVTATAAEVAPLLTGLGSATVRTAGLPSYTYGPHDVDVLVTGVGLVATAARVSAVLARHCYERALNVGVCGSFDRALAPGTVVHVVTERLPELGAEDGDAFLSAQQLRLIGDDEFPFCGGALHNGSPPQNHVLARLPRVEGISVNTVHGDDRSIARLRERCTPGVESMEGAAFMYACLIHGIPFAEVRAVSNFVERRNRDAWRLDEAIRRLGEVTLDLLKGS